MLKLGVYVITLYFKALISKHYLSFAFENYIFKVFKIHERVSFIVLNAM
jgi:hypothetical protein